MPDIEPFSPRGMFHEGWTAEVNDYAIACGWALKGKRFKSGLGVVLDDLMAGIFAGLTLLGGNFFINIF